VTGRSGEEASEPTDPRATGERIEQLLEASSASGPVARERAEELVRVVVELYGAGLERLLEIAYDAGALTDKLLDRLADDELVASLMLVHGLHPHDVHTRVERALEKVRPYLGSHGGDVELLEVTEADVVRLRMLGSCDGCASSAVTLQLAVEGAIAELAPEVVGIEVDSTQDGQAPAAPSGNGATSGVISVESLSARLRATEPAPVEGAGGWQRVAGIEDLASGEVRCVPVAGLTVAVCRVGRVFYAFRDGCPACSSSLAGAPLERALGAAVGSAVLRCPGCGSHYEVHRAGAGVESGRHLDPLPLLERDGGVVIAVPAAATA
jgi:Fe-S cluster biogenesis protein NfuA/nitrite reductase/ring-hydroxylating ferredoxin subunit